jgi:thioredoxin reductase (NADPH)
VVTVIVVGDGPAGLSAALFLAKNDQHTVVFGDDETAMHYAYLRNFLGIEGIDGTRFQEQARAQVVGFGAEVVAATVAEVATDGDGFVVRTVEGREERCDYLVLAGARRAVALAESLGAVVEDGGVCVDADQRTSVEGVYAAGRAVRPHRSQAIISAGAGAVVALDILAREAGRHVTDWDTPPEEEG